MRVQRVCNDILAFFVFSLSHISVPEVWGLELQLHNWWRQCCTRPIDVQSQIVQILCGRIRFNGAKAPNLSIPRSWCAKSTTARQQAPARTSYPHLQPNAAASS
ncbi:hypothetical protein C8R41DRAFT_152987 [Lentinula lateritia]|uniref:Secreted protein n=1 Tax=Lentinula lateritia TaxID=40482 RepID=A0ABQ8VPU8_9AGAR|nr:hypothetical protein C8R41DRAFT_152987 [Lentinula lateritia]